MYPTVQNNVPSSRHERNIFSRNGETVNSIKGTLRHLQLIEQVSWYVYSSRGVVTIFRETE